MSVEDANLTFEMDNLKVDFPTSTIFLDSIIKDFVKEVLALVKRNDNLQVSASVKLYTMWDILTSKLILMALKIGWGQHLLHINSLTPGIPLLI